MMHGAWCMDWLVIERCGAGWVEQCTLGSVSVKTRNVFSLFFDVLTRLRVIRTHGRDGQETGVGENLVLLFDGLFFRAG